MLDSKLASTALVASSYCRVATLHRLDSTRGNANQDQIQEMTIFPVVALAVLW
jgi:hypothetical protein